MDTPKVLKLIRPFDPMADDAEENYDEVVRRVNSIRVRRTKIAHEASDLERQFVENDLIVLFGPRRGERLEEAGRRHRLIRLLELEAELQRLDQSEAFARSNLDHMNEALDRWARETYGG
jgi:hypothetical protein